MKKEWLLPRAAVPVDMETTTALVEHIKKLEGNIETLHAMYEQVSRQRDEWRAKQDKRVWTFWDLSGADIVDAIKTKLKEKNT